MFDKMKISLIAAMGSNRVIGNKGKMPWNLPDDLAYFMEKTRDHYVLLGRKTFRAYRKIMQDHKVIVVSRQSDFDPDYAKLVHTIDEGIKFASDNGENELFVSGGGEIYRQCLSLADRLYITRIHHDFEGDVFFPEFNKADWNLVLKMPHGIDDRHVFSFDFMVFERKMRDGRKG